MGLLDLGSSSYSFSALADKALRWSRLHCRSCKMESALNDYCGSYLSEEWD